MAIITFVAAASMASCAPAPAEAAREAYSDTALYKDVAEGVRQGRNYYEVVADLHRKHNYPLKPVIVVRPPALAYVSGVAGPTGLLILAWGLWVICLAAWLRALEAISLFERVSFLGLMSFGAGAFISPGSVYTHDLFSGLLVTLALGLTWDRRLQIIAATGAVLIRELAAPLLVLLLFPWSRDQAQRVIGAGIVIGAYYAAHALNVANVVRDADPSSQGWFGLRGLSGLSDNFSDLVGFSVPTWFALLPLLGWAISRRTLSFLWCAGVTGAICVVARADNVHWLLMMMPVYLGGIAFLWRTISRIRIRSFAAGSKLPPAS